MVPAGDQWRPSLDVMMQGPLSNTGAKWLAINSLTSFVLSGVRRMSSTLNSSDGSFVENQTFKRKIIRLVCQGVAQWRTP